MFHNKDFSYKRLPLCNIATIQIISIYNSIFFSTNWPISNLTMLIKLCINFSIFMIFGLVEVCLMLTFKIIKFLEMGFDL